MHRGARCQLQAARRRVEAAQTHDIGLAQSHERGVYGLGHGFLRHVGRRRADRGADQTSSISESSRSSSSSSSKSSSSSSSSSKSSNSSSRSSSSRSSSIAEIGRAHV